MEHGTSYIHLCVNRHMKVLSVHVPGYDNHFTLYGVLYSVLHLENSGTQNNVIHVTHVNVKLNCMNEMLLFLLLLSSLGEVCSCIQAFQPCTL